MIEVRPDDLSSAEVQALVAEHLAGMHSSSPPGHVNALALEQLRAPDVTFWTAWMDGALCGCGALKQLDARTGEIKSMRTRAAFVRRGVGQAVLDEIVRTARSRGYVRLYLETGTGDAFAAAHALYLRNGFEWCGAFGDYRATDFNVFMTRRLAPDTFELTVTVAPGDIDEMGHVNNVHYLRWVQQVAAAHWTAQAPAEDLARVGWVVLRHEIDYKKPARAGDAVVARTWVGTATNVTYERHTQLVRAGTGELLAKARTLWCPVDRKTGRPTQISAAARERFSFGE